MICLTRIIRPYSTATTIQGLEYSRYQHLDAAISSELVVVLSSCELPSTLKFGLYTGLVEKYQLAFYMLAKQYISRDKKLKCANSIKIVGKITWLTD